MSDFTVIETKPGGASNFMVLTADPAQRMVLPADPAQRKGMPITTGVLDYFPLALAEVARVSKAGNDQHNPGQPLHWDKTKSLDHADCIARHLVDRGTRDADGQRHAAKLAWRALALLETLLEKEAAGTQPAPVSQPEPVGQPEPGWTSWDGLDCRPVAPEERVEIRMRGGYSCYATAGNISWTHFGAPGDVLAYRRVTGGEGALV